MLHPLRFAIIHSLAVAALAQSPFAVPGLYILELNEEPAAGFAIRTRSTPSARRIAMQSRRAAVRASQSDFRRSAAIADRQVVFSMDTLHNALVLRLSEAESHRLAANPRVRRLHPVHQMQLTLDSALPLLKVPEAWQSLGGSTSAGAGIKIGVIDSGIDETHPGFQAPSLSIPPGFPKYDNVADISQTTRKVIVQRNYTSVFSPAIVDLEDRVGHGTAVAMAAAGMPIQGPGGVTLSGVAPGAWLGSYKIAVPSSAATSGASRSDVFLKALNDAIADGMDVVNVSMTVGGGWLMAPSEVELFDAAARQAAALGVLMIVGAGNDGPERHSIASSPSYSNLLVGGTLNSRLFAGTAVLSDSTSYLATPPVVPYVLPTAPVAGLLTAVEDLDPLGRGCLPLPAASLNDRIAVVRGIGLCGPELAANIARDAGARGMLLYSENSPEPTTYSVGSSTLPVLNVSFTDGLAIVAKLRSTPGLSATLNVVRNSTPTNPERVAGFSARGPDFNYLIRPDLLAVAHYITSAAPGNQFVHQAGTSFAAPMVAGAAAILRAARPGLSVDQYFSLLTNNATPILPDGQRPAPVMEQGAGRLNLDASLRGTLAAIPRSLSFNYGTPNVNQTLPFSLVNLGSAADTLQLSIQSIDGVVIPSLSTASLSLAAGQSTSVNLILNAPNLAPGEYQGFVRVRSTATTTEIRIPYWYAVQSTTPRFIKVFTSGNLQAGSTSAAFLYFRITDASGIPLQGSPTVQAITGGATLTAANSIAGYQNLYYVGGTFSATPGDNIFRISLGGLTRDVGVATKASGQPRLEVSQAFFDNVIAGASRDATVNIFNTGTAVLNVTSLTTTDPQFQVTTLASGFTVAPGAFQAVNVRFTPTRLGLQAASIIVTSNDTNNPNYARDLRGTAVSPAGPMQLNIDSGASSGSWGFPSGNATAYFVSRITPPRYPATLTSVQIYFGNRSDGLTLGTPLTIVAGANPSGSENINGVTLQTATGTVKRLGEFNSYPAPGVTVNSGDLVVGMMVSNPPNIFPADSDVNSPALRRAYTSSNGTSFFQEPAAAGNFLIRATVTYPGGCNIVVTQTAASVAPAGDNGRILITASSPYCAWSAQTSAPWLTLASGGVGQGNGKLAFTAAPNTQNAARSGVIALGNTNITVHQPASGCAFQLGSASLSLAAAGGNSSVTVNTTPGCAWTPSAQPSWTTLTTGAQTGAADAAFTATANPLNAARTGSIQVAGFLTQLLQPAANPAQVFQDVPLANPFSPYIGLMRDNAITSGCTSTTYCPDSTTTRGQMAVFIVRALFGDSFDYQSGPFFTDVPTTHPFFKYIQKMRQLGVTSGCSASTYCPDDAVTRGQMAVFIVRARLALQPGATLYNPATAYFGDVPTSHPFFTFIQKMRQLGVTSGCSSTAYCPDDPTTRGQMAVFILRGLLTP